MPRPRMFKPLTFAVLGLLAFSNVSVEAGNTTCAGNLTDWYTNAVGETACETYQRLRQICNPSYQVPNFRPNTPGDNCDDQLADCCCNSISWALSMLCMNCQWDVIGGSPSGIDAGIGAYGKYRSPSGTFCSPGTNQTLPATIQTSACNAGIKLDNFLYELFWNDGSWFFVYTMDYASQQQVQYNNDTFTHCNSTTPPTSVAQVPTSKITANTSPPTTTATTTPSTSSSHANTASVVGGVVGGIAGLALVLGTGFVCWRKRNQYQHLLKTNRNGEMMSAVTPHTLTSLAPDDPAQGSSAPTFTNFSSDVGPRSDGGASYPSKDASEVVLSPPPIEPARHDDLGPMPMLERSASGRLPPAYDPHWEQAPGPQARPLPLPTTTGATTSPTITQPRLK